MGGRREASMRLIEPYPILDVYADGIGGVEILGTCVRLTFFTWQAGDRLVVAKIIRQQATLDHIRLPGMINAAAHQRRVNVVYH